MSATETDAASAHYAPFTPFEETYAFDPEASTVAQLEERGPVAPLTPFVSEYVGEPAEATLETSELHEFLTELYDNELDELLEELAGEAAAAAERGAEVGEVAGTVPPERFLDEWARPVVEWAETMLETIAEAVGQHDVATMGEAELESFFEQFEPRGTGLEQHFEDFLKGLWRKVKKAVGGVVGLAKKGIAFALKAIPGLGAILRKLKALVRPLLKRVLGMAIDRLPAGVREPARRLAERVLGEVAGEATGAEEEQAAVPEVASVQQEFDLQLASLLTASDEVEQEVITSEAAAAEQEQEGEGASVASLLEARERLVDELEQGEDPTRALENFIPAVLPIARVAIGLIGRSNVVGFLARFLSRLIERYVGPAIAPQLSQAIVDTGLRLITLEAPTPDEVRRLAPEAVAGAVEDTVRRVAELDEATFEDQSLLEAAVTEAFHESAAENFPQQLLIPELHEVAGSHGTWVFMPRRGRRKYYKKYTRVFDVEVTPQMAAAVTSFGGKSLASFLRDQLGVTPPVRARMHLYQATYGTWLSRIARYERGLAGLDGGSRAARSLFHPLTPEAAGILLQQPRLGRRVGARFLTGRNPVAVGQRFYFLELPGARVRLRGDGRAVRGSSDTRLQLDLANDRIRVSVYLSEGDAQDIAAALRRRDVVSAIRRARRIFEPRVRAVVRAELRRRGRVAGELAHEDYLCRSLTRLGRRIRETFARKISAWVGRAVAEHFANRSAEFVAATEDPADGVTISVVLTNAPGTEIVRRSLQGRAGIGSIDLSAAFRGTPAVTVRSFPGRRDG